MFSRLPIMTVSNDGKTLKSLYIAGKVVIYFGLLFDSVK